MRVFQGLGLWAVTAWTAVSALGAPVPVDGFAASVNGKIITVGDVLQAIQPMTAEIRQRYQGRNLEAQLKVAFNRGLENLVDRELILADFLDGKVQLPERAVDDRINELIVQRFDGNRAVFLDTLSKEGITLSDWREQIREELIVNVSRQQHVMAKASVSPQEVRKIYEARRDEFEEPTKYHVRVITIPAGFSAEERADRLKLIFRLRYDILAGGSFEDAAREYSAGGFAEKGGDMGWVPLNSLRQELRGAVEKMEPGDLSDIIEGDGEFFLVQLLERVEASTEGLEAVEENLRAQLLRQEQERIYDQWIGRLKKKYPVKIF